MTSKPPDPAGVVLCAEAGQNCGTPLGWRHGGRCPRCRAAHNEETRDLRRVKNAPPPVVIETLTARVQAGEDLTAVANDLGVHPRRARVWAGLAEPGSSESADLLRMVVAHLLAMADGGAPRPEAAAWRVLAPGLAEVETRMAPAADRMARARAAKAAEKDKERARKSHRLLKALEAGAPSLRAAAEQAGVNYQTALGWVARDAASEAAYEAARKVGRALVIEAALAEVTEGRSPAPVLKRFGRAESWLRTTASKDPVVHAAVEHAKNTARAPAEQTGREQAEHDTEAAARDERQVRSRAAAHYRRHLTRLVELLEAGTLMKDALATLNKNHRWLHNLREAVPEADRKIKEAAKAGAAKRPMRTGRPAVTRPSDAVARAIQLVVAAVAQGGDIKEAARAAGATTAWIKDRYHRDDAFREALRSAGSLNGYDPADDLADTDPSGMLRDLRDPMPPRADTVGASTGLKEQPGA